MFRPENSRDGNEKFLQGNGYQNEKRRLSNQKIAINDEEIQSASAFAKQQYIIMQQVL